MSEKKLLLAKRTQEQLREILQRKQSLSLNLKRVVPSSEGNSLTGDDVASNSDLKSFQDECNRKLKIASALNLLHDYDLPLSVETTDTFHTAAADSPEFLKGFGKDEEHYYQEEESENKMKSEYASAKEDCTEQYTEIGESSEACDKQSKSDDPANDHLDTSQSVVTKCSNTLLTMSETTSTESLDTDESPQHQALKRLQQRVARQRMIIMRSLEANAPCKEDLNRQIALLQDLQRQHIELEVSLLAKGQSNDDTIDPESRVTITDQEADVRDEIKPETLEQSVTTEMTQQPATLRTSPSQTYTSVYLTVNKVAQ